MTNPSDAVGTNGAYGGRTSVDAFNDVLGVFQSAGILSGWYVRAGSGMTVLVGGQSGVRDVAIAEDQLGDRTTVNNRLGSPISVTIAASSPSTARVDSIVLYVNKPATVSTTTIDNPEACGIIAVSGTTTAPSSADIRSAITADGGSGATAYYVVIADITIPASATVITQTNITNYNEGLVGRKAIANGAIGTDQLANGAVETRTIADGAVTSAKMNIEYYTTEQIIGKWVDGSTLYRKVIDFGALPNASEKYVAHGLPATAKIHSLTAMAFNPSTQINLFLPTLTTNTNSYITFYVTGASIAVNTYGTDRSGYTQCHFVLEYTK